MEKDWAIIRQILLRLEDAPTLNMVLRPDHFEHFAPQDVAYNMGLLAEAGFIEAAIQDDRSGLGDIHATIGLRLNNSGRALLDTTRNDAIWTRIKDTFRDSGLDLSFDLVASVGQTIAETAIAQSP